MSLSIGIHQSFDGFTNALVDAYTYGFTAYQVFMRNNRNMKRRTFLPEHFANYNAQLSGSKVMDLVVHAPYAMNPASGDPDLLQRTRDLIKSDLMVMQGLNGRKHYVLHPGAYTDYDKWTCFTNLVETVHDVSSVSKGTRIAIENMAGQGTTLISDLEQLGRLAAECADVPDFSICLDTCHMFGAGIEPVQAVAMLDLFGAKDRVSVLHINDSKCAFRSFKDRHANIGCGYIGERLENWTLYLHDEFPEAAIILETPEENLVNDCYTVKSWFSS